MKRRKDVKRAQDFSVEKGRGWGLGAAGDGLFLAEAGNSVLRYVASAGLLGASTVTTWAGGGSTTPGQSGYSTGVGSQSYMTAPQGVAADAYGNVFITEVGNSRLRKVVTATAITSTIAGSGTMGGADNPSAVLATLNLTQGIAVDTNGHVFFSDAAACRLRVFNGSAVLSVTRGAACGYADGGATAALFSAPAGLALSGGGGALL